MEEENAPNPDPQVQTLEGPLTFPPSCSITQGRLPLHTPLAMSAAQPPVHTLLLKGPQPHSTFCPPS